MKEFKDWKEAEELDNYVYYSKQTSTKMSKVATYTYYNCQRDGHDNPHRSKSEEGRKSSRKNEKGVVKTNMLCPSRIICKSDPSGEIDMTYISTHSHPVQFKDTEHHPIPSSVMEAVKSKLLLGASVDNIHKDLREGADVRENRDCNHKIEKKHAVTKRNLREIARKLKVNRRMHPDDATSLFHIVKKLSNEKYDPILLYKPQGEDVLVGPANMHGTPAESQSFLLGIQTKEQLEMFQKHASKIVCLDSTHCTNKYDFKLVTLVVPD